MKNTDVALVIFQAKAAISEACEGRACLPECLRAIERAASVETAAAPLVASGAKAAKRTTAEAAHPHGARLRVPVGGVRPACRAFASFSRRARGLFRRIWRGLAARLPAGARLARNSIAAVVITLGVTSPFLRADVVCTWNGTEYICSGEGSAVRVVGGGSGGGDSVVTNIVGVCTNCVAMSPEYVADWKAEAVRIIGTEGDYDGLLENARNTVTYSQVIQSYLAAYTNTYPVSGLQYASGSTASYPLLAQITNFLSSVSSTSKPVTVANNVTGTTREQVLDFPGNNNTKHGLAWRQKYMACYDGAATAYNDVAQSANSSVFAAQDIETQATAIQSGLRTLRTMVDGLSDEECTAQYSPGDGSGGEGSGGGGSLTNQVNGNWCTYDQGEAIKELLTDIKKWEKDQISYLQSVSNYLFSIDASIKSALFSRYTHIPTESNMGDTWQDVYLAGQPTQWGYEPTNILQRIELLIYGMSGVGTNNTDVAEATGVDPDEAETAGDEANEAIDELSVGDSAATSDVRSIMDALTSFFRTFNGLTGDRFSGQTAMGSYSVEIGERRYDVPALAIDQESSNMANVVQSACRAFLTCAYLLFAVFCGWRFYVLFLGAVVKYAKWAQELLSSLFAD